MIPAEEQALAALNPTLLSLDPKMVAYPNIPPATYVLEMNALVATYLKHTARYVARNIDTAILSKKLENAALALSAAEYKVLKALAKKGESQVVWDQNNEDARELLDEALSCLDYVIPDDCDTRRELESIIDGTGNADFILDLSRTAALCREFVAQLAKRAFTEPMIEQLQEFYVMLSEAYGAYSSDKKDVTPELNIRNRAFTYCKSIEMQIKKDARLLFRKEPEMLEQYRSEYMHQSYLRYKAREAAKKELEAKGENA